MVGPRKVAVRLWPSLAHGCFDPADRLPPFSAGAAVGRESTAVIVDVLRATTTLTVALGHGVERVIPVASVEEARALRVRMPQALLCGEREGRRVEGFDLGNSPTEYRIPAVRGRTLIFSSTNGSRAMLAGAGARQRILAAFVNAAAVVERLADARDVVIVCAGKLGRFALEDAACAGLLCERLRRRGARLADPRTEFALSMAPRDPGEVRALVQGCAHGRYLRSLGGSFARDVEFCAGLDTLGEAFEC